SALRAPARTAAARRYVSSRMSAGGDRGQHVRTLAEEAVMKNVLVLMHDDAGQEARFQAALDLVRALDGHLTCLDIAVAPAFVGDYADVGGTALLMGEERSRERANRAKLEARLKVEGVSYEWID